jgi:hypothetical protein
LHSWLKQELNAILNTLPAPAPILSQDKTRMIWESWREGVTIKATLGSGRKQHRRWV